MTEATSDNIIEGERNERKSTNIAMSLAISTNNYLLDKLDSSEDIIKAYDGMIEEDYDEVQTDGGDIAMTYAKISANLMKIETNETNYEDQSITPAISTNCYLLDKLNSTADIARLEEFREIKKKIINYNVYEQDNLKQTEDVLQDNRESTVSEATKPIHIETLALTTAIPVVHSFLETDKSATFICGNDNCGALKAQPIPADFITIGTELFNTKPLKLTNQTRASNPQENVTVFQASATNSKQHTPSTTVQNDLKNPLCNDPPQVNVKKANDPKFEPLITEKIVGSPAIPINRTTSLLLPRDMETLQVNLKSYATDPNIDVFGGEDDAKIQTDIEEKKRSLSNMSDRTLDGSTDDKCLMAIIKSDTSSAVLPQDRAENNSAECMFTITKDSEDTTQTDGKVYNKVKRTKSKVSDKQVGQLQRSGSELKTVRSKNVDSNEVNIEKLKDIIKDLEQLDHLRKKLAELQTPMSQKATDRPSRLLKDNKNNEHANIKQKIRISSRTDVTRSFLDLISNITGDVPHEDDDKLVTTKTEDQAETIDHKRPSLAPNRQSTVLSRDFLSNISVAQKMNDSDCTHKEDTTDATSDTSKKSCRTNHTVDTKFNFSDESINEASFHYEDTFSPLKKTAFGETSYMIDGTKRKVIPTYLKNVSDGIKNLMIDLLKPVSTDHIVKSKLVVTEKISTHSVQIQVNLVKSNEIPIQSKKENTVMPEQVLLFDYSNPLNNILLAQFKSPDVHKYNPSQTDATLCDCGSHFNQNVIVNNYEMETSTNTQLFTVPETSKNKENIRAYRRQNFSSQYEPTITGTKDQSIDAISTHFNHNEVNNNIDMRRNKDLLRETSPLTLVEAATKSDTRAWTSYNTQHANPRITFSIPHRVNAKGQAAKLVKDVELSGISFRQRCICSSNSRASSTISKHDYSHATDKHGRYSNSEEVTSKSITKMQTIPISPELLKPTEYYNTELSSADDSTYDMATEINKTESDNQSTTSKLNKGKSSRNKETCVFFVHQSPPPAALVIDQQIPVNNILLPPTDFSRVHKYYPRQTDTKFCESGSLVNNNVKGNINEVATLNSTQFTMVPDPSTKPENLCVYRKGKNSSFDSSTGVTVLLDRSVDAISTHLTQHEVNTIITVRVNQELLAARSSLTILDNE